MADEDAECRLWGCVLPAVGATGAIDGDDEGVEVGGEATAGFAWKGSVTADVGQHSGRRLGQKGVDPKTPDLRRVEETVWLRNGGA